MLEEWERVETIIFLGEQNKPTILQIHFNLQVNILYNFIYKLSFT